MSAPSSPGGVRRLDHRGQVADLTRGARVLEQHTEGRLAVGEDRQALAQVEHQDRQTEGFRAGPDHVDRLRETVGIDDEDRRALLGRRRRPVRQGHRLCGSGSLVQE
jgi:hypothetical protein